MRQRPSVRITVNGRAQEAPSEDPARTLLDWLREDLGLTAAKRGCSEGHCGSCTVLVNGKAVNSCLFPAMEIDGASVTTIEGLAKASGELHPLQTAFIEQGAVQCGYCTPGMIMSAKALLDENPAPTPLEIKKHIAGNLCRCGGYKKIVEAILDAAERLHRQGAQP